MRVSPWFLVGTFSEYPQLITTEAVTQIECTENTRSTDADIYTFASWKMGIFVYRSG